MNKILTRIQSERALSQATFQNWRQKKREQFKVMFEADKDQDKVTTNLFASLHKTFIALSYEDELTVKYQPIWMEDEEVADNMEIIAKNAFNQMWLDKINWQKQSDRAIYNVSIRLLEWDEDDNKPETYILDPMSWYADPSPMWPCSDDYRWHWFDTVASIDELKEMWYDTDWLIKMSEEQKNTEIYRKEALWQDEQSDDTENKIVWLANHYFKDGDIWYKAVCNSDCSKLLELKEYGEECPIVLNFYELARWSATGGASLLDRMEDKQRMDNKLVNLMLIKAIREWLWGDFVYDWDVIRDASKLGNPTTKRRYIKAGNLTNGKRLQDAIMELPQSQIKQDVEMMRQTLRREWQTSVWIDQVIQWVRWDKSITASESQTIQQNANLNLALNNKIDAIWEKDFWRKLYKMYQKNFDANKKLIARLSVGFGSRTITIDKKDFMSSNELDVIVVNKSDKVAQMEKEKLSIPYYQQEANNPELSKIVRLFFKRKIARLSGMQPDEIQFAYFDPTEEKAKEEVILLNYDKDIKITDPSEDQMTYLMIYKRAIDTPAKERAIIKRSQILKEQLKKQTWQPQGMDKMLNNQMMSNSLSQQRQSQAPSAQDITNI